MNPSYLDIFQVSLAIFTVLGLCALTGYKKMFNLNDASIVRKIFYMIITPALFFREIGQSEFKYETWLPFINEILVQITLHVLLALIVFILPFENKKKMFIQSVFSNCYTNTIIIGYPLVRGVYGLEYLYVPTTINIVLNAIIVPLHTLMVLPHKAPQEAEENYEEDQSEDGIEKGTGAINEIVVDSSDSEHQSSSNEHSDNDNNNHPNDQNNQPKDETHKIKKISVDHHENDDEENNIKEPRVKWTNDPRLVDPKKKPESEPPLDPSKFRDLRFNKKSQELANNDSRTFLERLTIEFPEVMQRRKEEYEERLKRERYNETYFEE